MKAVWLLLVLLVWSVHAQSRSAFADVATAVSEVMAVVASSPSVVGTVNRQIAALRALTAPATHTAIAAQPFEFVNLRLYTDTACTYANTYTDGVLFPFDFCVGLRNVGVKVVSGSAPGVCAYSDAGCERLVNCIPITLDTCAPLETIGPDDPKSLMASHFDGSQADTIGMHTSQTCGDQGLTLILGSGLCVSVNTAGNTLSMRFTVFGSRTSVEVWQLAIGCVGTATQTVYFSNGQCQQGPSSALAVAWPWTPDAFKSSSSSLPAYAIALIVVGSVAVLGLAVFAFYRYRRASRPNLAYSTLST